MELSHFHVLLSVLSDLTGFDGDCENGMGPRTRHIHRRRSDDSVLVAERHDPVEIIRIVDDITAEIFHKDTNVGSFLDLESSILIFAEQITHLFVIDLQVSGADQKSVKQSNTKRNLFSVLRISIAKVEVSYISPHTFDSHQLLRCVQKSVRKYWE